MSVDSTSIIFLVSVNLIVAILFGQQSSPKWKPYYLAYVLLSGAVCPFLCQIPSPRREIHLFELADAAFHQILHDTCYWNMC